MRPVRKADLPRVLVFLKGILTGIVNIPLSFFKRLIVFEEGGLFTIHFTFNLCRYRGGFCFTAAAVGFADFFTQRNRRKEARLQRACLLPE